MSSKSEQPAESQEIIKTEQQHHHQERDINDAFDDIVLSEERLTRQGYDEGFTDGCAQGNEEGFKLGYAQGVLLGQELGAIYGLVVAHQQQPRSERVKRTLEQLREAIDAFPQHNDPDKDIIGEVEHIRTLHKRLRAMLGLKQATTENTTEERKDFSF